MPPKFHEIGDLVRHSAAQSAPAGGELCGGEGIPALVNHRQSAGAKSWRSEISALPHKMPIMLDVSS